MRLDRGRAVLERVADGCGGPGQLAGLADRHEADACDRGDGAGEEATRLDARHDVELTRERRDQLVDLAGRASASTSSGVMSRNSTPGSG